jgi:hypothetical protein
MTAVVTSLTKQVLKKKTWEKSKVSMAAAKALNARLAKALFD